MVQRWTQQKNKNPGYVSLSPEEEILITENGLYELRAMITFIGQYFGALYNVDLVLSSPPTCGSLLHSSARLLARCYDGAAAHELNKFSETVKGRQNLHIQAVTPIISNLYIHVCTFMLIIRVNTAECHSVLSVNYHVWPHLGINHKGVIAYNKTGATFLEIQSLPH